LRSAGSRRLQHARPRQLRRANRRCLESFLWTPVHFIRDFSYTEGDFKEGAVEMTSPPMARRARRRRTKSAALDAATRRHRPPDRPLAPRPSEPR
jgi:hypothetical protein